MNRTPAHCKRTHPRRGWGSATLVVGIAAAVVTAVVGAAPVGAHGGDGILSIVSFEPVAPDDTTAWNVEVELRYSDDDHTADDATVTLSGDDGAGADLTPVALEPVGEGRYIGRVDLPGAGTWDLRVVSIDPPGQLAMEPVVAAAGGGPDGGDVGTTPTTVPAPDPGAVADVPPATMEVTSADEAAASPTDGGGLPWWVWVLVVLAVATGVGAVVVARRTSAEA